MVFMQRLYFFLLFMSNDSPLSARFEKNKKIFLENVENRRKNALQILKVVVLYRGSLTKAVCASVKQREYVHHFPPYHIFLSLGSLRFTRGLSFDFSGSLSNVGV